METQKQNKAIEGMVEANLWRHSCQIKWPSLQQTYNTPQTRHTPHQYRSIRRQTLFNMSSIIKAVTDIFASVVELIWSFFTTAGTLVQKTAEFALKFVTEILDLVVNFFRGLVDLAGGLVSFLLGNVLMLGVVAAAVFGFLQYQRSQGRTVQVGNKKLN
ncbi:hypothetical protein J1614_003269 [Plenodomus biglobosus]|nr:hypothetical protein J1614_003269 [Plenodomus biglobosus]